MLLIRSQFLDVLMPKPIFLRFSSTTYSRIGLSYCATILIV